MKMYTIEYASPVGLLTLAGNGEGIKGLWIEGQKYDRSGLKEEPEEGSGVPALRAARDWLDAYFAGERPEISRLSLSPEGSAFRRLVWELLCEIPYGELTTYGRLAACAAERLGLARMSAQAVGGAVAHNPISIIIPCHRVVGTNGSLTGYAGGIQKKCFLLAHEGADMSGLFVPQKGTAF